MPNYTFNLPEAVLGRARAAGGAGEQWLAGLSRQVAELEVSWQVQTTEVLEGGSEALVLAAERTDGTEAVLKLGLPGSADLSAEARVYHLAQGRGYAALLAHDDARNALLLERLGPPLASRHLPARQEMEIICATLRRAWLPLSEPRGLMTGAEKSHWLANFIAQRWQQLHRPCAPKTKDRALAYAAERAAAFDPTRCVLVHGDAHALNTLISSPAHTNSQPRCKLIDPDGLFAEPEADLAIPMRGWNSDLRGGDPVQRGHERRDMLADLTGCEREAIWQWGFIERVSTGLMLLEIGMEQEGRETLAIADLWAGAQVRSPKAPT